MQNHNKDTLCCVAVCTAKRPVMFRACLESLINQAVPPGWKAEIIVVDNDAEPRSEPIVGDMAARSPFPLAYVHEPKQGIPFARNSAIEASLRSGAEWIAFIDDDEVADNNWLQALMEVASTTKADILHGRTLYNYPPLCKKWMPEKKRSRRKTGDQLVCASTNNVMFRTRLVNSTHFGLRFDTGKALTGGSDTAFFYKAADNGARIIYVAHAVVTENVPEERCTYKWRMKRYYRCSANSSSIEISRKGRLLSALHLIPKLVGSLVESMAICLLLPFLIFHIRLLRKFIFKAGRRLAYASGIIAAYLGRLPKPYETIDGC